MATSWARSLSASTPSTRKISSPATRERLGDELAQLLRHRRLDLEADDRAAAAALQRALEEADEILGLFLDLDVRIADDAEGALPFDRVAGEEPRDEQRHRLVEADEAVDAARRSTAGG